MKLLQTVLATLAVITTLVACALSYTLLSSSPVAGGGHGPGTWLQQAHILSSSPTEVAEDNKKVSALGTKSIDLMERLETLERAREAAVHDGTTPIAAPSAEARHGAKRGKLMCNGKDTPSEIIYWREVPGDLDYEAPTTPHHADHDKKYLTFEYDLGGWNNVRMGVECIVVVAHAMGRTLIAPPAQNLYLLGQPEDLGNGKKRNRKLGFADFFALETLEKQAGLHTATMAEFLAKQLLEASPEKRPPDNRTDLWGQELWKYLKHAADAKPKWSGHLMAMPRSASSTAVTAEQKRRDAEKLGEYARSRPVAKYDVETQAARHVHIPGGGPHRLLQHFYAFAFFADPHQRSFYRRMMRDMMRYQDEIQCAGHRVVEAVREVSRKLGHADGTYYALHIRRGDFQFKEVKISAGKMVENLRGHEIIPRGALVYVATDDPNGECKNCFANRQPCPVGEEAANVSGCMVDPSWAAFRRNGWTLLFMHNLTVENGPLAGVNPNFFGMVDSIVCSRAAAFAGTWFSTFTGYIHRLRGYHGLGEQTYYHSTGKVDQARAKPSIGNGYAREFRVGWTDDGGELI